VVQAAFYLAVAAFFAYAGVRTLRSPERQAGIRFQPWTYRRVEYTPTERDVRNARLLGYFLLVVATLALGIGMADLLHS
jgi:hypothetical protein